METQSKQAPGRPGVSARWTSSSKTGVGKALNALSDLSFTLSHGILNEVYYPVEDHACIRDMELLVTDGKDFFSEEKRNTKHSIEMVKPGIPAYEVTNECLDGRYAIHKEIVADPMRSSLLQRIRFVAHKGDKSSYHLYVLLAPHLNNHGEGNTAWIEDYKGIPMLFAARDNRVLALACSVPWIKRSAGFVGSSDGWTDINEHRRMTWEYGRAENGNVALTAEIRLNGSEDSFTLALGFGEDMAEAGHNAKASIVDGFDFAKKRYVGEWEDWQKSLSHSRPSSNGVGKFSPVSATVLRVHEAKRFVGGTVASMSFPWGFSKGDDDVGGYHMVWPRDLVETAGGFLAMQSKEDAFRVLNYLMVTQEADGHWPQTMWIEGSPNWRGIQMDQMALPILLVDLCWRHDALKPDMMRRYWQTVKRATGYLVQHGPGTQMDRWEEVGGYTPFTLAVEIAALLAAADFADDVNEPAIAKYCRETADEWNENIEYWTYVTDTPLANKVGVKGYYIRVNPDPNIAAQDLGDRQIRIQNRPGNEQGIAVNQLVSVDALALVRFGLRAADDPRILDTVKVIDAQLKTDTPSGPSWHRYNNDGYGEHEDGSPFDGTGIGRVWPLLTGERAHYEIAAGNFDKARELLKAMEAFSDHGLFSEQVWDSDDIPDKELYKGRPSGSAMPLVWAHAEYIKLCRSLKNKKVFDMPNHTVERYIQNKTGTDRKAWRFERPFGTLPKGKNLRIETKAAARVHWSVDGWKTTHDARTRDTGLGVHVADLNVKPKKAKSIVFTFYWKEAQRWEGKDFRVEIKS